MQAFMSPGKRYEKSLWKVTSTPGPFLNSLEGEHKTEVAVIGAGVAGLSTALHLAEAGCSVAVIEAHEPGSGATGKSGGLIAPDFIKHSLAEIKQLLGEAAGERLIKMVGSSARQCFDLVESQNISCDARQDGFWVPAHDEGVLASLRSRAEQWQMAGFDVQVISAEDTARQLGASRYCGAIRFSEGGSLNPLAFVRGLAEAAIKQGATIYANSQVNKLVRHLDGWRVITASGQLDAQRIVLAANGGNAALHSSMKHTVLPLSVFEFATAPLSAVQKSSILPEGGCFTDKQSYIFSGRYDREGRLISAFPDFSIKRPEKYLYGEAKRRLLQHFPILESVPIEHLWHGTAWLNPSLLPKIYGLEEGLFAIQACNGRGLATNTVLGKEMATALIQKDQSLLSVNPEPPVSIRAHRLAQMAPSILMAKAYLKDRINN